MAQNKDVIANLHDLLDYDTLKFIVAESQLESSIPGWIKKSSSFKLKSIHPANEELLRQYGGVENLPPGARIPDLLKVWGELYNRRQPESSRQRLKAIRLDMYRWESGQYSDYDKFVTSWHQAL